MRKKLSLGILVGVAVLSLTAGLNAGYSDMPTLRRATFDEKEFEKGMVLTTRKDVDVSLSGMTRQEWLGLDKIKTLRASNDDQLSGFKSRSSVDFMATYGNKTYGRSAADAKIRLSNYGFWRDESYYTPFSNDTKAINMLTYMEEMWIDLHFGTFFTAFNNWFSYKNHPVSVKMGYFPYILGRGIALGDFPIHTPYLGWDSLKYDDARFNMPGILIHGNINKDITYDLYYSKHTENSILTSMTWETINSNRTDGRRQWRGIAKDRDLWAARMDFNQQNRWGDLHVQPYMMYVDAPELKIEVQGDAASRLGTAGMMVEFKRGRFSMNAEVAGQFGHQNVHAIDRNVQAEETDSPSAERATKHSHVFTTNATSETKSFVNGTSTVANVNNVYNRGGVDTTTKQWIPAVTKNGDRVTTDGITSANSSYLDENMGEHQTFYVYNSNVTGNARFRDSYRLDYRGFMGVIDMKYEFEQVPVSIAAAGAYISGDKYPYNTEKDKRYRGFITYGDYYYVGKYVYSQVLLEERKLPRPVDLSYHYQYAFNNYEDMGNLAYLGTGVDWRPFKDKNRLSLRSNVLWFWETCTLKKWNKHGKMPIKDGTSQTYLFVGDTTWVQDNHIWSSESYLRGGHYGEDYFHKGWETKEDASRSLGIEVNFEAQYRPLKNCILMGQLGCFIPGQLYKDVDGMPNVNTVNSPQDAIGNYGLGHDPVWRACFAVDYRF